MPVLVTCKFDKDPIKGDWEKLETSFISPLKGTLTPKWQVRYDQKSTSSEILCLSSLPVSLMKTEFIVTEKRWRHHSKSMGMLKGEKLRSEKSDPAQTRTRSSFYACPCYLQVWQISDQRWLRKAGDIIMFHRSRACNTKVTGQIWSEFEPIQDVMPVLVTCKFDEDWIHSNWEKVETSFSPLSQWEKISRLKGK